MANQYQKKLQLEHWQEHTDNAKGQNSSYETKLLWNKHYIISKF